MLKIKKGESTQRITEVTLRESSCNTTLFFSCKKLAGRLGETTHCLANE